MGAGGFLSRTVGIPPISDAEWCQSRCASQAAVAVRPVTSATHFPSREDFHHAQARLAPTTTQQQPLVAREGRDTTLVVKVTVDRATTQGDRVTVGRDIILGVKKTADKAIIQEDKEMVDKDIIQEVKEMVDKATIQEEGEEDRGIIQEARGTYQALEDRVTTL